jgi:hypothetical protein
MKPKFGLNQNATAMPLEVVESKNGNEYLKLTVHLGEKKFYWFGFEVTRAWDKDKDGWVEEGEVFEAALDELADSIFDILKAFGVPENEARWAQDESYNDFIHRAAKLTKKKKAVVDVFLEWEPKIREGQERTWLQLPKSARFGQFICQSIPGEFAELNTADDWEYLVYEDESELDEEGKPYRHPFVRSNWFMNSSFSEVQGTIRKGGGGKGKSNGRGRAASDQQEEKPKGRVKTSTKKDKPVSEVPPADPGITGEDAEAILEEEDFDDLPF